MPNTTASKKSTMKKKDHQATAPSAGRAASSARELDAADEQAASTAATSTLDHDLDAREAAEAATDDEVAALAGAADEEIDEEVAELARTAADRAEHPDEVAVAALWARYTTSPTQEDRNELIVHYVHIVRYTAERLHTRLPGEVDVEDLMSAGLFGLMDAIDNFDPERGVKFETYCSQRIRGAIYDELRAMDWVPRLVRSRTAKVEKVRKSLEMELGRSATDQEIVERLGVRPEEYAKLERDSKPVGVVSLDRKWFETDSSKDVREIDVIKDARQSNPVQEIARQDLKTLLTKGLARAERLIVILYYYEEMTMKEIGATLDLSESRVSQMHSSIIARLKVQMQHRSKDV